VATSRRDQVITAAELDEMTPAQRQAVFDASIVTDVDTLPAAYLARLRASAAELSQRRDGDTGPPAPEHSDDQVRAQAADELTALSQEMSLIWARHLARRRVIAASELEDSGPGRRPE
jgi:hypothetical protein